MTDFIDQLLEKRGIKTKEEKEKFLNPNWERDLLNPFDIKDMEKSVERIKKAIDTGEKIIIYSDYDCDGIPGGVVLHDFFELLQKKILEKRRKEKNINKQILNNQKDIKQEKEEIHSASDNIKNKKADGENKNEEIFTFENYIPHRHNEGYGVNKNAVEKFIKDKVDLIITVDLGITNLEEIKFAKENSIDVIVTDHHLPLRDINNKQIIPEAFAVINTKRDDCDYGEKMLCGCATAWKLVNAFLVKYREEYNISEGYEKWWLDMVGISTVADMVPLVGENRLLAKYGLEVLKKTKRPGLLQIFKNAKIDYKKINETDIGFGIAPRLNAAGRMSDPKEAFLSLLSNDESSVYAMKLENYNNKRKKETTSAHEKIDFNIFEKDKIILIGDESWTPGILGLIASKVVDKTKKTVFVWGKGEDENIMKGSVRAGSDGANVVELMSLCGETLDMFGGHEEAGGFALHKDNIDIFKGKLEEVYNSISHTFIEKNSETLVDLKTESKNLDKNFYKVLQQMSPFGVANKNPVFEVRGEIKNHRIFGDKGQHIEINFNGLSCIKFNVDEKEKQNILNSKNIKGQMEWDNFKNNIRIKIL